MDKNISNWAEIDLRAIRQNIKKLRSLLNANVKFMTVVKANAYGHGMLEVSQSCVEEGVDYLGVARLEEAIELREAGIELPILVLGHIEEESAEKLLDYQITATVFNKKFAKALAQKANEKLIKAKVHIKIDTGMGRLGFRPDEETIAFIEEMNSWPGIFLEGIFTHFAAADEDDNSFTSEQLKIFEHFIKKLEEKAIVFTLKHSANSAAMINMPETHLNMVRAGISVYGLYPSNALKARQEFELIPAMTLKSRVTMLKTLHKGESVSYGRKYFAKKEMTVATVPIGYADGYSRLLSNQAWAMIKGQKASLIGTVCMDQSIFDVSEIEGIKEGDEVILLGKPEEGISADDLANIIGTINYEIVCMLSARVARFYI